jgi:hypothetical protein
MPKKTDSMEVLEKLHKIDKNVSELKGLVQLILFLVVVLFALILGAMLRQFNV